MCLMQTDLPVPDGPRIIEILPSGRPMFRPRRIWLRPNALWTSMNSTASGHAGRALEPGVPLVLVVGVRARRVATGAARRRLRRRQRVERCAPAAARRSALGVAALAPALGACLLRLVVSLLGHRHPPIGARGLAPQNSWVPSIPMRCTSTMLSTIDFAVAVPTPTGPPLAL